MKIFTFNVNGIRAALKKDLADWLRKENPDVICFQEIKLSETELVEPIFTELGYHCYWQPAQKKGYSGVGLLSKIPAQKIISGVGVEQHDSEGRTLLADFGNYQILSAYFPSGTMGNIRQTIKMQFLEDIFGYAHKIKNEGKPLFIAGDVNICHTEIDIHNPKSNANTSGFLPEERAWVGKFIDSGFIDGFRAVNKEPHNYTWWSYRAGARAKNLGWRIDYIFATNINESQIEEAKIHSDVFISDHCPVSIEVNV